jgi:hypothetical protein
MVQLAGGYVRMHLVEIALGGALFLIVGCAPAKRWPQPTEPATVVVQFDGKPVAGALVLLGPIDGGHASRGTTGRDGLANLTTFAPGDGAVAGRYRLLVSCEEEQPNPQITIPDPKKDLEGFRAAMEAATAAGQPLYLRRQLLPARYVSFETSDLKAEIRAGVVNQVVLDLVSAAPAKAD